MGSASIGGLASGLDTASIIEQFMALEAVPQTKLKTQVTTEQSKISALQKLNTALATLASSAKSLADASKDSGTWGTLKATSSAAGVTVSAGSTAQPGSLDVTVDAIATSASGSLSGTALTPGATFALTQHDGSPFTDGDGNPITITLDADPTYSELATAINATSARTGLQAVVVHGTGGDVLQVRSSATGLDSNFGISDGTTSIAGTGGANGQITVNGVTITSSKNTYNNVVDGVSLTVAANTAPATTSTVTLERDASSRSAAVQGLVDAVNSVLTMIGTQSATNPSKPSAGGVLAGDAAARQAGQALTTSIWPADGTSLAQFGIELDRTGKFTFNATKFADAYQADPDAVTAAIVGPDGLAKRVENVANAASDKYDGYITAGINGRNSTIDRLNKDIDSWDDRLAIRRTSLERQYTALETALASLQAQSSWLSGQLSSLNASSE